MAGFGRLHGFRQPLWGEPLRSGHARAVPGRRGAARVAGSLVAPDLSPQSSSSPNPLRRPRVLSKVTYAGPPAAERVQAILKWGWRPCI